MQRRLYPCICLVVVALLSLTMIWTPAWAQSPSLTTEQQEPTAFAYAAPALIKELDTKYPFPPPVPPSPPRPGGVLHLPSGVLRSFDPTAGYTTELALVWDTLLEWESTWYFPEAQTKPMIRKSLAESWEMVDPSTWIFHLRKGVKFHNVPPVHGREMVAEDVRYSYELLKNKAGYSSRTAAIKEVQVLDPHTVRFHLSRVVRGTVLSVKHNTYVDAARAAGASSWRIILWHILPNVFAPILIIASVWLGNAIVIEAALSFLGLGTPPPTPTWGGMLSGEGRRSLETAPYLAVFPGLAISIVVLAFNMFGDAVRDLLDPRLRTH